MLNKFIEIGIFMRHVGVFWKNPFVTEDPATLLGILRTLKKEGVIMLIPDLEKWVLQHTSPKKQDAPDYVGCLLYPDSILEHEKNHIALF